MASQQQIDEIIEKLCDDVTQIYRDVEFESRDLHDCLIKLIDCVELIPELAKADKKKVVLGVVIVLVERIHIKDGDKEKILFMLSHDIIDMIIEIIIKVRGSSSTPPQVPTPTHYCQLL
jgi:glutaminase